MKINTPKLPIFFEYIVFISFIEVFFFIILNNIGFQVFQLVPYLRIIVIFFTILYILRKVKIPLSTFSFSLDKTSENRLMFFWFLITIISFIIGLLKFNPILYLLTDFLYLIFGFFIFRLIKIINKKKQFFYKLNNKQAKYFIGIIIILTLFAAVLEVVLPSFLVIFTMCYGLYLLKEKEYKISFFYFIPFLAQIFTANRALILVLAVIIFFAFTIQKISIRNVILFLLSSIVSIFVLFYFLEDILSLVIDTMKESSALKQRLVQLHSVFSGNINWNTPAALSLKQRLVEINLVIDYWLSNFFNFIFGGGLGATLDGSTFKDKGVVASAILGKGHVHNIHVLPFSILLRYGLLGLILIFLLVDFFLKYFKIILFKNKEQLLPLYLFVFCWILYSIPAASYLWTTPLFWISLSINSDEN
ncbi:hypothetical protein [Flavobacterium sp.]|jgi:hypothetical protein|uniref:hypothetical protein n=1 Tax=Flavobacterium sp. TaxID=239 RepID=UPI0037C01950